MSRFAKDINKTKKYTQLGTPDYLPPEMIQAENYDYLKIDIYQCGKKGD